MWRHPIRSYRLRRIAALAGILAAFPQALHAEEAQAPPARVPTLGGGTPGAPPSVGPHKSQVEGIVDEKLKQQKPLAGWQNGFYLQSADGANRLRVGGYIQADARAFPSSRGATGLDSFFLRLPNGQVLLDPRTEICL